MCEVDVLVGDMVEGLNGKNKDMLCCIYVYLDGFEWFVYNRSFVYNFVFVGLFEDSERILGDSERFDEKDKINLRLWKFWGVSFVDLEKLM